MPEPAAKLQWADAADKAGTDLLERERQGERGLHAVMAQRETEQPVRDVEGNDDRHPPQQRLPARARRRFREEPAAADEERGDDDHHHGFLDVEALGDVGDDGDREQRDGPDEREAAAVREAAREEDQRDAEEGSGPVRELADVRRQAGRGEVHSSGEARREAGDDVHQSGERDDERQDLGVAPAFALVGAGGRLGQR